ncbi:CPBP family intramembrane glutamic endopeptidase [Flammeovirgaceae bacterium SG7u.111]|nr:CPBP family intramembrane glutamic endopeptidase [Flammeovirgaceae bacterium SG7u.132]WPO37051.1 CPBP family intramembrane glutamic endopeptidase [Flammeovirgaceae bacterium SG7u.111]
MALDNKIFKNEDPRKLWYFLGASILISWVTLLIPKISFAYVITPFLVALFLATFNTTEGIKKDFRDRIVDIKRINRGWLLLVLLFHPTVVFLTYGLSAGFGLAPIDWECIKLSVSQNLLMYLVFMIFPSIFEQAAWRGFALDRMQLKWTALQASLLTALFHIVWCLPLFFEGNVMASIGLFTPRFFAWVIQMLALSVVYTVIYNNNQRSILITILFHVLFNITNVALCYKLAEASVSTEVIRTGIYVLTAAGFVVYFGAKHLLKEK